MRIANMKKRIAILAGSLALIVAASITMSAAGYRPIFCYSFYVLFTHRVPYVLYN